MYGAQAAAALEALVPVDIIDLPVGKQRYAFFTNAQGGIMDDLMVANMGDHLFVVVNAACKAQDIAHLKAHLPADVEMEVIEDRALLALQGPKAAQVLARLQPAVAKMLFMDVQLLEIDGAECIVSRSGYTGEDGYEISVPADKAAALARKLTDFEEVEWIALVRATHCVWSVVCVSMDTISTQPQRQSKQACCGLFSQFAAKVARVRAASPVQRSFSARLKPNKSAVNASVWSDKPKRQYAKALNCLMRRATRLVS